MHRLYELEGPSIGRIADEIVMQKQKENRINFQNFVNDKCSSKRKDTKINKYQNNYRAKNGRKFKSKRGL